MIFDIYICKKCYCAEYVDLVEHLLALRKRRGDYNVQN